MSRSPRSGRVTVTNATSASSASHSSSAVACATSRSVRAELTTAMISARRDASTNRRTTVAWSSACALAEADDHDGMVAIPLGAAGARHLAARVEPRDGSDAAQRRVQYAALLLQHGAERALASGAVEQQHGLGHAGQLLERPADGLA